MVAFFVSSMVIVVLLSFGRTTNDGFPSFATSIANYQALWNEVYLELFLRSLVYAVATVVICLLIAYPVAYAIARHGGRYKNALVARSWCRSSPTTWCGCTAGRRCCPTRAWSTAAARPRCWRRLHVPRHAGAVIGGLVYGYVVFMILPIYASLERMDGSLIEAGRDLYGPVRTFFAVTVPATRAGAYAGLALVFLPAMGDFVSAQLLGGADT